MPPTITNINRFRNKEPGRGTIKSGIYNVLLTGYVKGTGVVLDEDVIGLSDIQNLVITEIDCDGVFWFDIDPATWTITVNDPADGLEIENDGADTYNIRVMYWGF